MNIGDGGITVSYEPTPDEAARAYCHGLNEQLAGPYALKALFLIGAAVFCFSVEYPWLGAAMLVLAVAVPLGSAWSLRLRLRKLAVYMCVPTTMRLTADGCEYRTDLTTSTTSWSLFSEIKSTREFWLFYLGGHPATFIPKSAFDAEQQAQVNGFFAARAHADTRRGPGRVSGLGNPVDGSPKRP
ncbi:YcxB family protein [Actinomadura sp. 9N215]|uniref:YcxB family protein n=1 Tax=Actinomadura sp. 9N215 TaxID=3375150 RepID=UPI0037B5EADA